jgi:Phospholipase_D-nuclease N-terminal
MHHPLVFSAAIAASTGQQALLLAPLVLISLVLMVVALIDLSRRQTVRGGKLLWAIAIVVVGTLGPIAYFIFARTEV